MRKVFPVRLAPKIPTTVFGFNKEASISFFIYLGIMLPVLVLIQAANIQSFYRFSLLKPQIFDPLSI